MFQFSIAADFRDEPLGCLFKIGSTVARGVILPWACVGAVLLMRSAPQVPAAIIERIVVDVIRFPTSLAGKNEIVHFDDGAANGRFGILPPALVGMKSPAMRPDDGPQFGVNDYVPAVVQVNDCIALLNRQWYGFD